MHHATFSRSISACFTYERKRSKPYSPASLTGIVPYRNFISTASSSLHCFNFSSITGITGARSSLRPSNFSVAYFFKFSEIMILSIPFSFFLSVSTTYIRPPAADAMRKRIPCDFSGTPERGAFSHTGCGSLRYIFFFINESNSPLGSHLYSQNIMPPIPFSFRYAIFTPSDSQSS